jgi:hypothetical protein
VDLGYQPTDWLGFWAFVVGNIKWMELVGKWMRWKNLYGFFLMIDVKRIF